MAFFLMSLGMILFQCMTFFILGGAWLVAYKAEQRRRFKAVLCCDPEIPSSQKSLTSKQRLKSTSQDEKTRKKLDGFYLVT